MLSFLWCSITIWRMINNQAMVSVFFWIEHIVSYSIPVGNTWSDALTVDDLFYDGLKETNLWTNGLGMLTDGHYGLDNFKMDLGARKGSRWLIVTILLCSLSWKSKLIWATIRSWMGGVEKWIHEKPSGRVGFPFRWCS